MKVTINPPVVAPTPPPTFTIDITAAQLLLITAELGALSNSPVYNEFCAFHDAIVAAHLQSEYREKYEVALARQRRRS